jgi:hypothetical protein
MQEKSRRCRCSPGSAQLAAAFVLLVRMVVGILSLMTRAKTLYAPQSQILATLAAATIGVLPGRIAKSVACMFRPYPTPRSANDT